MVEFFTTEYAGVLGLSSHTAETTPCPSPWSSMVQRGTLENNMLAMSIPNEAAGESGALTFGGIDPAYASSPFLALPLAGDGTAWSVPLRSLAWADPSDPLCHEFPAGATAIFTTDRGAAPVLPRPVGP